MNALSVRRFGWATASGLALGLSAGPALAQSPMAMTPSLPAPELLRFDGAEEAEAVSIPQFDAGPCPMPPVSELDGLAGDLAVARIEVSGIRHFDGEDLAAEWRPLEGRSVSAEAITRVLERVECRYAERGFVIARAWLEPSETPGVWRLTVREGLVSDIEFRGFADPRAEAFLRRAFAGVKRGRPLRLGDLRRGLDTASRYGFWELRPSGVMSSGKQGSLSLVIEGADAPAGLFASLDNASSSTVDRWGLGVGLAFNGPSDLYERTLLGAFTSPGGDEQQGLQLSSRALVTRSGLEVGIDLAAFTQRPREEPPFQDTVGETRLARLELRHPVHAMGDVLVDGTLGLDVIRQHTDLAASGTPTVRDDLAVLQLGLEARRRRGTTAMAGRLTLRQGLEALGASEAGEPLLSRSEGQPDATVIRLDVSGSSSEFGGRLAFRVIGQAASDPLLAFEELALGGFAGARPLDPGALSGDEGVYGELTYVGPALIDRPGLELRPTLYVAGAAVWNQDSAGVDQSGLFAGAGIEARLAERLTVEVGYAATLGEPENVTPSLAQDRVYVTVRTGFSF